MGKLSILFVITTTTGTVYVYPGPDQTVLSSSIKPSDEDLRSRVNYVIKSDDYELWFGRVKAAFPTVNFGEDKTWKDYWFTEATEDYITNISNETDSEGNQVLSVSYSDGSSKIVTNKTYIQRVEEAELELGRAAMTFTSDINIEKVVNDFGTYFQVSTPYVISSAGGTVSIPLYSKNVKNLQVFANEKTGFGTDAESFVYNDIACTDFTKNSEVLVAEERNEINGLAKYQVVIPEYTGDTDRYDAIFFKGTFKDGCHTYTYYNASEGKMKDEEGTSIILIYVIKQEALVVDEPLTIYVNGSKDDSSAGTKYDVPSDFKNKYKTATGVSDTEAQTYCNSHTRILSLPWSMSALSFSKDISITSNGKWKCVLSGSNSVGIDILAGSVFTGNKDFVIGNGYGSFEDNESPNSRATYLYFYDYEDSTNSCPLLVYILSQAGCEYIQMLALGPNEEATTIQSSGLPTFSFLNTDRVWSHPDNQSSYWYSASGGSYSNRMFVFSRGNWHFSYIDKRYESVSVQKLDGQNYGEVEKYYEIAALKQSEIDSLKSYAAEHNGSLAGNTTYGEEYEYFLDDNNFTGFTNNNKKYYINPDNPQYPGSVVSGMSVPTYEEVYPGGCYEISFELPDLSATLDYKEILTIRVEETTYDTSVSASITMGK